MAENQDKIEKQKNTAMKVVGNLMWSTILLTMLAASLVFLGFTYVVVFLLACIMPGFVALIMDRRPKKRASKTVLFFNLTGISAYSWEIFSSASPDQTALALLGDPMVWLVVYGFAGFGWLLVYIVPQIVFLILHIRSDHMARKLEHRKQQLIDEWGDDIRRGYKPEK